MVRPTTPRCGTVGQQVGQLAGRQQVGAVDDDEVDGQRTLDVELGARVDELLDRLHGGGPAQPVGGDVAAVVTAERVRQPAGEAPLGAGVIAGEHPDAQLGRRVRRGERQHQSAGRRLRTGLWADDRHRSRRQQVRLEWGAPLQLLQLVVGVDGVDR